MTVAVVVATEEVERGSGLLPTAELGFGSRVPEDQGDPDPAAVPVTLLERLLDQLAALKVQDSYVITRRDMAPKLRKDGFEVIESDDVSGDLREIARLARTAGGPMLVLHGDIVVNGELLARMMLDSKGAASAVVAPAELGDFPGEADRRPTRPVVRLSGGRVVSAGSRHHQVTEPNGLFRGVLRVAPPETRALAEVADKLAALVETPGALPDVEPIRRLSRAHGGPPDDVQIIVDRDTESDVGARGSAREPDALGGSAPTGPDAPALLLVGLVRGGTKVTARGAAPLVCDRALTQEQADAARAAVEAIDEDRVRLEAAVKSNDGLFTTYAVSTYSHHIARWTARRHMTPNMVTSISMGVAVLAAVWFAEGTRSGMILGAVLLYLAFVLDCVDGQLARYTRQFSTLGAWLDATFDRAKEYVVYAGLAVGSTAAALTSSVNAGNVWGLAVAALALQTVRHMVDFSFEANKRRVSVARPRGLPLTVADDGVDRPPPAARSRRGVGALGHLAVFLSNRTERIGGLRWAKKVIVLPIGERFALICLTAALFNAQVTFIALLVWGSVAAMYTLTGRVLRSLAR